MPSHKRAGLPSELLKPIIVPDYVKVRKKWRQEEGMPLCHDPDMDFVEAQEAFNRDKELFERNHIRQQQQRKLQILAQHMQLPSNHRAVLAQAGRLPGFCDVPEMPKGRPEGWNLIQQYELWCEVDQLMRSGNHKTAWEACMGLARKTRWQRRVAKQSESRKVSENLYERYLRAKRTSLVRWVKNIRAACPDYDGDIALEFLTVLQSDD